MSECLLQFFSNKSKEREESELLQVKQKSKQKSLAVQSFYGTRAMQTKFLLSTRTLQLHWKISMNQFAKAQKNRSSEFIFGALSLSQSHSTKFGLLF